MSELGLESLEKIAIDHVRTERVEKLNEGIDHLKDLMQTNLGMFKQRLKKTALPGRKEMA